MFNFTLSFASADVDGLKEAIRQEVEADIQKCMPELGDYAQELLEKSIQSQLYGSISGHYATGTIGGAHELEINGMGFTLEMAPDKVALVPPGGYGWDWYGMNVSNVTGESFAPQLVEGLNTGGIGPSQFNPNGLPETRYFEHAFEQIEANAVRKLASLLSAMGYQVSF